MNGSNQLKGGIMGNKISELGRHKPSVESVISRLVRHQDRIKRITVVLEWDDKSSSIHHDDSGAMDIAYDAMILNRYAMGFVENTDTEIPDMS